VCFDFAYAFINLWRVLLNALRNNAGYRASDHNEARMSSSAQFYIIPSHCASCHAPLIKMSTLTMGKQA